MRKHGELRAIKWYLLFAMTASGHTGIKPCDWLTGVTACRPGMPAGQCPERRHCCFWIYVLRLLRKWLLVPMYRWVFDATSLYTVTIVVLLYNNSWLNFRACTRNLSPCLVKCVWCSAYYWFRLKKEQVTVFMHFWLAFCYFCCLFSLRYRCIWGMCGWDSVIFRP